MRTPFGTEVDAFHFLLLTIAAFAAIALASILGGAWAGVPVWAVLTAAAAFFYFRRGRSRPQLKTAPAHAGGKDERRIVVLANQTLVDETVIREIERATVHRSGHVLVVSPACVSTVRRWTSDLDDATAQAKQRLDQSLDRLHAAGIEAHGEIGSEDPVQAIEDSLRTFGADEIIITTQPRGRTDSSQGDVVAAARERFALPITVVAIE